MDDDLLGNIKRKMQMYFTPEQIVAPLANTTLGIK